MLLNNITGVDVNIFSDNSDDFYNEVILHL